MGFMERLNEEYWQIRGERGKVYGDPKENHHGIAQIWSPILSQHWETIRQGKPLPEWVVAALMVGLKYDRMRVRFHEDNYIDLGVYLSFMYDWQKEWQEQQKSLKEPLRIYVAGPFSKVPDGLGGFRDASESEKVENVNKACEVARTLMRLGHFVHCPHSHTEKLDGFDYEDYMALDFDVIRRYCNALFLVAPSPGANRELALAESLNYTIFRNLLDVPDLKGIYGKGNGAPHPLAGAGVLGIDGRHDSQFSTGLSRPEKSSVLGSDVRDRTSYLESAIKHRIEALGHKLRGTNK